MFFVNLNYIHFFKYYRAQLEKLKGTKECSENTFTVKTILTKEVTVLVPF